ncbi:U-box domain-containing protein 12-like [Rhododendron vialii]|uniref:U-box domain-containing protein 12-like n=1 Tax=Rhododendron vialii TaxID=182163 RepID=UPI00265E570B|nr:U-box domain-containing protein 12-like [Rhododendron vialii]
MAKCQRNGVFETVVVDRGGGCGRGDSFRRMILNTMRCGGPRSHRHGAKQWAAEKPTKQRDPKQRPECGPEKEKEKEKKRNGGSEKLSELLRLSDAEAEAAEEAKVRRKVEALEELKGVVKKLQMDGDDDVFKGAVEVRRVAKENPEARSNLALMGAIPPLVSLLDSENVESQVASLYALLNLGIGNEENKSAIVKAGSIHKMLKLIESPNGPPNAALAEAIVANFLGLSALDSNKPIVGSSGAIPFLVKTLKDVDKTSSSQAKQDSLRALYNLSISPLNVPLILDTDLVLFLFSRLGDMEISERILSILGNIVSTSEGRKGVSIVPDVLPILIDVLNWTDSPGCQEKASYILMIMAHKSYGDRQAMIEAGVASPLLELTLLGSTLAQKRASRILDRLRVDKGKQVSESFGGGMGANVSAPICGFSSKSADPNLELVECLEEEEGMMSEEKKAVKQLVQQSLQNNMRRMVKRADLPQDFVPSDHLIKSLTSSSTSKSLPL